MKNKIVSATEAIAIIRGVPSSFENGDFLFQTYVDPGSSPVPVPEPATLLLCGTMAGLGVAARWRKRGRRVGLDIRDRTVGHRRISASLVGKQIPPSAEAHG